MTTWIVTAIAVVGCVKLIFDAVFAIGRWTKKVEHDVEEKPKVTLDRLSWDIEKLGQEIRELGTRFDGRYTELAARVNVDHSTLREIGTWRAGLIVELSNHFYTIQLVDRIAREGEIDRKSLHLKIEELATHLAAEIEGLKKLVYARRSGDTA